MKRPVVLLPAGPVGWASYNDIYPQLLRIWDRLGFQIIKVWFPRPRIDQAFVDSLKNASQLIFPLGVAHYDGLWLLRELRQHWNLQTPAVIMTAADLTAGYSVLFEYRASIRDSDVFVTNCSPERDLAVDLLKLEDRVFPIPLPVAQEFSEQPRLKPTNAQEGRTTHRREKIILYAGRVSTQKNVHSLIACLPAIVEREPATRLLIAGQADELGYQRIRNQNSQRYMHELCQLIVKLGLQDSVQFVGHLEQTKLVEMMRASDVTASLTLHSGEDFGTAIAQAIALGRPTVVTRWGGGVDFIERGGALGVDVRLTENGPKVCLQQATEQLLNALCEAPAPRAENFSDDKILRLWRSVIKESTRLQGRSRPRRVRNLKKDALRPPRKFAKGAFFESAKDPLYLKICSLYGAKPQTLTPQSSIYWNPLFDFQIGIFWDSIAATRTWPWTQAQKRFLDTRTNEPVIHAKTLSKSDFKIAREFMNRGILLQVDVMPRSGSGR